jgi:hypothetical protein
MGIAGDRIGEGIDIARVDGMRAGNVGNEEAGPPPHDVELTANKIVADSRARPSHRDIMARIPQVSKNLPILLGWYRPTWLAEFKFCDERNTP